MYIGIEKDGNLNGGGAWGTGVFFLCIFSTRGGGIL